MDDAQWVIARIGSGTQQIWLAGFDKSNSIWVASVNEAVAYDREGAEAVSLQCINLSGPDKVLYALCRLMADDKSSSDGQVKPMSSFESGMLDAVQKRVKAMVESVGAMLAFADQQEDFLLAVKLEEISILITERYQPTVK